MWPLFHRTFSRRNLSTSLVARTNFAKYSSETFLHSAINMTSDTHKPTACFGWTGFRVSVRSFVLVAIICRELREFDARIPNAGMITSARLAAKDFTSGPGRAAFVQSKADALVRRVSYSSSIAGSATSAVRLCHSESAPSIFPS